MTCRGGKGLLIALGVAVIAACELIHMGIAGWPVTEIAYRVVMNGTRDDRVRGADEAAKIVSKRMAAVARDLFGIPVRRAPRVERRGDDEIVVRVPGLSVGDVRRARHVVESAKGVRFVMVVPPESWQPAVKAEIDRLTRLEADRHAVPREFDADQSPVVVATLAGGVVHRIVRFARVDSPFPYLVIEDDPSVDFGSNDFEQSYPARDSLGFRAVGFTIRRDRRPAFFQFTTALIGHRIAIVQGSRVWNAPTLNGAIGEYGIVAGGEHGFEPDELDELTAAMRPGALPSHVRLIEEP